MTAYRFLVLLKPEANRPGVDRRGLLQMVHDHFERHNVEVLAQSYFSGSQFREMRALEGIYPRLSVIAQAGERALTPSEHATLAHEAPNVGWSAADEARLEFDCSEAALCAEGDRGRVLKLGPGAYAAHFVARNRIVLNHFFPEFRDRFYASDAAIIAFECQTAAMGLHTLRDTLIGHIQPDSAPPESLRASALARARELRLGDVSVARNFFHISPGYLEAAYQLAILFPERGTLQDRLAADASVPGTSRLPANLDPLRLSTLFAETEPLPRHEALQALIRWTDGYTE